MILVGNDDEDLYACVSSRLVAKYDAGLAACAACTNDPARHEARQLRSATAGEMRDRVLGVLGHPTARNLRARMGLAMRRFRRAVWSCCGALAGDPGTFVADTSMTPGSGPAASGSLD
jgi:hypothetical protein